MIRHELAQRTRHQLRRMPNLLFFPDDSLDYIENIDNALKGNEENPIDNPDILDQRQKR
jgi:ribosome-binding factor A